MSVSIHRASSSSSSSVTLIHLVLPMPALQPLRPHQVASEQVTATLRMGKALQELDKAPTLPSTMLRLQGFRALTALSAALTQVMLS